MDFEKICMMFTMQEPFYGILLSSMERIEDKRIGTIAVGRTGNVFKLLYNPDFVNQFNTDTVLELLKHETLHVALNHFSIMEDKHAESAKLANVAADLEANCYVNRSKIQKEAGGVFCENEGLDKNLGARAYYDILKSRAQQDQQKQQAQNPNKPCNGGLGGQSQNDAQQQQSQSEIQPQQQGQNKQEGQQKSDAMSGSGFSADGMQQQSPQNTFDNYADQFESFDDHSQWPTATDENEAQLLQESIDSMLAMAAEETEKRCGEIPGELAGRIEKIRKRPRPVADWRRYFRRYLGNEFSELIRKSKKRESRRFPDAAGNRHQRKSHILVAIDTSGSVSMPEYREFFGQIKTLKDRATFHVIECDARIQHEYDYNGKQNEVLHGGGGTDFCPVINRYLQDRKKYDALVYFTDGGAWIPDNTPKETLWVISSRGDHDKKRYKVNGASVVFIKNKQNE